jgi:ABC-type transport system substrate-binding protein
MKRIAWPSLAVNKLRSGIRLRARLLGLIAIATVGAPWTVWASTRPKFGGTLRIQVSERVSTIDPRQWPADSIAASVAERVDSLVFDRLVRLDQHGVLQPALAVSWQHDAQAKRWDFRLREGVKFSDGALLTPAIAAMALQQLLGVSYDVSATSDTVVIQGDHALPNLAMELSSGRFFIFHVAEDNSLSGTGPFRVAEWPTTDTATKAVFAANENCWAGRPFIDKVELIMGAGSQQEANAILFGQADIVDLPASEVRRDAQRGVRAASSDPIDLFALVVDSSRPAVQDARIRQAISLSIDRSSIADVILQKQGIAAGGLLPNWISGYAHLFPPLFDLEQAKSLLAASGQEHSHSAPLVLLYDSGDAEARGIAERVAVNLRETGILMQVSGQNPEGKSKSAGVDMRLVRYRISISEPGLALAALLSDLGEPSPSLETLEQVYSAERAPIDAFHVIPLVHVSESYGLGPQVRDWMAPRWGGWDLADVWLGPSAPGGASQ